MDEPPAKKKKRAVVDSQKHIWLITYTVCSPDITADILASEGVKCDECHSISWRESKYTLIHLGGNNKLRASILQKAMASLETKHSIKQSHIVGFDPLASNDKHTVHGVEEHPGFLKLVEAINETPDAVRSWLQEGTVLTNKKGVLWKYLRTTDFRAMTKGQLVAKLSEWEPIVKRTTETNAENDALKTALSIREKEMLDLKAQNAKFFNDLIAKMDECTAMKCRLVQHGIDHSWTRNAD